VFTPLFFFEIVCQLQRRAAEVYSLSEREREESSSTPPLLSSLSERGVVLERRE
jgi:hypothetical protein